VEREEAEEKEVEEEEEGEEGVFFCLSVVDRRRTRWRRKPARSVSGRVTRLAPLTEIQATQPRIGAIKEASSVTSPLMTVTIPAASPPTFSFFAAAVES
jgi:hypothetical protein